MYGFNPVRSESEQGCSAGPASTLCGWAIFARRGSRGEVRENKLVGRRAELTGVSSKARLSAAAAPAALLSLTPPLLTLLVQSRPVLG